MNKSMSEKIFDLFLQARNYHDACDLEKAAELYKQAINLANQHSVIPSELLDSYAELSNTLGDYETAANLYRESIRLFPSENSSKYMALAQLSHGHDSLDLYKKGIALLKKNQEDEGIKSQIASAYAAISELFMTDLCDEPNAESTCELCIKNALKFDDTCIDAYQILANLRLIRGNYAEARDAMEKFKTILLHCGVFNLPSSQSLGESSRTLVELEDWDGVLFVCDVGLSIDDTQNELIYMQAFALYKLNRKQEASELLDFLSQKQLDSELQEAVSELHKSLSEN
ncbi:unnamed protein product [Blepharisma stoltei]|uniref:Tetratricopeptide repeat protein n=1 Tax=Blepharisma stoltei TaxID=1481888 RepID=A0AAU9KCD6_9CILI|nr:unnamed protein product [Blepharisma stoltei]